MTDAPRRTDSATDARPLVRSHDDRVVHELAKQLRRADVTLKTQERDLAEHLLAAAHQRKVGEEFVAGAKALRDSALRRVAELEQRLRDAPRAGASDATSAELAAAKDSLRCAHGDLAAARAKTDEAERALERETADASRRVAAADRLAADLTQQVESLRCTLSACQARLADGDLRLATLTADSDRAHGLANRLLQQRADAEVRAAEARWEADHAAASLLFSQAVYESQKADLVALNSERDRLRTQASASDAERLRQLELRCVKLSGECGDARVEVSGLRQQLAGADARLQDADANAQRARSELADLQRRCADELAQLRAALTEQERLARAHADERSALEERLSAAVTASARVSSQLAAAQLSLEREQAATRAASADRDKAVRDLDAANNAVAAAAAREQAARVKAAQDLAFAADTARAELGRETAATRAASEARDQAARDLAATRVDLEREQAATRRVSAERDKAVRDLDAANNAAAAAAAREHAAREKAAQDLAAVSDTAHVELDREKAATRVALEARDRAARDLDAANAAARAATARADSAQREVLSLTSARDELQRQCSATASELAIARRAHADATIASSTAAADLRSRLTEADVAMSKLREQVALGAQQRAQLERMVAEANDRALAADARVATAEQSSATAHARAEKAVADAKRGDFTAEAKLKRIVEELRTKHANDVASLQTDIRIAHDTASADKDARRNAERRAESLADEIANLRRSFDEELEKRRSAADDLLEQVRLDLERERARSRSLEDRACNAERQRDDARAATREARQRMAGARASEVRSNALAASAHHRADDLEDALVRVASERDHLRRETLTTRLAAGAPFGRGSGLRSESLATTRRALSERSIDWPGAPPPSLDRDSSVSTAPHSSPARRQASIDAASARNDPAAAVVDDVMATAKDAHWRNSVDANAALGATFDGAVDIVVRQVAEYDAAAAKSDVAAATAALDRAAALIDVAYVSMARTEVPHDPPPEPLDPDSDGSGDCDLDENGSPPPRRSSNAGRSPTGRARTQCHPRATGVDGAEPARCPTTPPEDREFTIAALLLATRTRRENMTKATGAGRQRPQLVDQDDKIAGIVQDLAARSCASSLGDVRGCLPRTLCGACLPDKHVPFRDAVTKYLDRVGGAAPSEARFGEPAPASARPVWA